MRYFLLILLTCGLAVSPNANAAGITFSALLGGRGNGYSEDTSTDAAVDKEGNIYIVGNTQSSDFPATPLGDPAPGGRCFVTKLTPAGGILYSVSLLDASGRAIAVNEAGEAVIAGETSGSGFAITNAVQSSVGGQTDAFVAKLTANGELLFATLHGGSATEVAFGIAVDRGGNIYATGFTESNDFPLTPSVLKPTLGGSHDAFLLKLSPDGSQKLISTYVGGDGYDIGARVMAARDGTSVYIAGKTASTNFVGSRVINSANHRLDAFVVQIAADTGNLMRMAFLGGTGSDAASGLASDGNGAIYICGETTSSDFPTTPEAAQPMAGGGTDLFVMKLGADLQALRYSTYLGGSGDEISTDRTQWLNNTEGGLLFPATRMAVDDLGRATIASSGESLAFPARFAPGAPAIEIGTGQKSFVARLNLLGTEVDGVLSVGSSQPRGLVITGNTVLITGATGFTVYPPFFPTTPGAFNGEYKGNVSDVFITQLSFARTDPVHPMPPNDNRANATPIDGIARTFAGSNTGATPEPGGTEAAHGGSPPHIQFGGLTRLRRKDFSW